MTRKCVDDDAYGRLRRRLDELARRVDEGNLNQCRVMEIVQHTIEGKMPELLAAGGIKIVRFLPLMPIVVDPAITTLERAKQLEKRGCTLIRAGRKSPADLEMFSSLQGKSGEVISEVGVLHYIRFSDEDTVPGTKRVLRDMQDNGLRPGTANEFLATLSGYPTVVKGGWGKFVVALGSMTSGDSCLRYEADHLGMRTFGTLDFMERLAPWWSSCYSFFVVKDS